MDKVITQENPQLTDLFQQMESLLSSIEELAQSYKPILGGERYMTDTELAKYLKLTKRTLQEYRNSGRIPFYQLGGKILYRESDIEKLLSDNRIEAFR